MIIIYSIYYINIKKIKKPKINKITPKSKPVDLYTFQFWKDKLSKSIYYYYPDFKIDGYNYAFATEFYQFKFVALGLAKFTSKKNFLIFLDLINNKDLLLSFFLLIDTYIFDFFGSYTKTYGVLHDNITKINTTNRRFLSILNYIAARKANRIINLNSIYIWSENQIHSKAFSIGVKQSKKDRNSSFKIFSYFASSFSSDYHLHLIPNRFELDVGIWGDNIFQHQDQDSLKEMETTLRERYKESKYNFEFQLVKDTAKRYYFNKKDLSITSKSKTRNLTFFSHGKANELYMVLFKIFEKNPNIEKILNNEPLYIRLHPAISTKIVNKQINKIKSFYSYRCPNIHLIVKEDEDILDSLNKTNYCIFAESGYINLALLMGLNVLSIKTSFLYSPPVQRKYEKNTNLVKIN